MNPLSFPPLPLFRRLVAGAATALLACTLAACGGGSGNSVPVVSTPSTGATTGETPATPADTKPEMRCAP